MILNPINQLELFGLEDKLKNLIKLFDNKTLPNKILFSGQKGIGKSTLAYHLINYALSKNEKFPYDQKNFKIKDHQIIFGNRKLGKSKMNQNIIFEAIFGVIKLKINSFFKQNG